MKVNPSHQLPLFQNTDFDQAPRSNQLPSNPKSSPTKITKPALPARGAKANHGPPIRYYAKANVRGQVLHLETQAHSESKARSNIVAQVARLNNISIQQAYGILKPIESHVEVRTKPF